MKQITDDDILKKKYKKGTILKIWNHWNDNWLIVKLLQYKFSKNFKSVACIKVQWFETNMDGYRKYIRNWDINDIFIGLDGSKHPDSFYILNEDELMAELI